MTAEEPSSYSQQEKENSPTFIINQVKTNLSFPHHEGGHAVAQLVEALRYEPEGRGFVADPSGRAV